MRRPAFIAGASSGIGAVTAQVLAADGYPVALGARRTENSTRSATPIPAPKTWSTAGPGSPSAPDATAASVLTSR